MPFGLARFELCKPNNDIFSDTEFSGFIKLLEEEYTCKLFLADELMIK